jgi:hypothetical protein
MSLTWTNSTPRRAILTYGFSITESRRKGQSFPEHPTLSPFGGVNSGSPDAAETP